MLLKNRNGWVLSRLEHQGISTYKHYFFCTCGHKFQVKTALNNPLPPEMLCPACGEYYFKDADEFLHKKDIKIWKSFYWDSEGSQDDTKWYMTLKYLIPIYSPLTKTAQLEAQTLLKIEFPKEGSGSSYITSKGYFVTSYNLFLDGKVEPLLELLRDDASYKLYEHIMNNKTENIAWLKKEDMEKLPIKDRLKCLEFFLKNSHLKEYQFFFWKMDLLDHTTRKYPLQIEMMDFIGNHIKKKSIRRGLYISHESSMKLCGFYTPYSDYIFSRSIENVDLLVKLYTLDPFIKHELFSNETFATGTDFIEFLKKYYSSNQITEFFITHIQDKTHYKTRLQEWKDTLVMLEDELCIEKLEEYFNKQKLTTKALHDEIINIYHTLTYKLDNKENFVYDPLHVKAEGKFKNLKFILPKTTQELHLWSKKLNNCMFGYTRSIHAKNSIIYGVFKEQSLLYAVELKNNQIVQAKGYSNNNIGDEDMSIVREWGQYVLIVRDV